MVGLGFQAGSSDCLSAQLLAFAQPFVYPELHGVAALLCDKLLAIDVQVDLGGRGFAGNGCHLSLPLPVLHPAAMMATHSDAASAGEGIHIPVQLSSGEA